MRLNWKAASCLAMLVMFPGCLTAQSQETFGGPSEGGGTGGSPAPTRPCWRYPIRIINNRKVDLHPQFAWWGNNFEAHERLFSSARQSRQPPDLSSLTPPPMPGWQRIKEGHFISTVAYGWLYEAVIEDLPSHTVTNKIILRNPPMADKAEWDDLVGRYYDLKGQLGNTNPPPRHAHKAAKAVYVSTAQQQTGAQADTNAVNLAVQRRNTEAGMSNIVATLQKFPKGTNYTVDLFALKIGYLQDGSHRQVFDLGQMYSK
jgi:hypothetical protein